MPDIDITTGVDTGPIQTGMAQIRNTVQQTGAEIQRTLTTFISAAAITGEITKIIDKAHELTHEIERFGVTNGEQFQIIANAAKEDGVQLDQIGRAMNRLNIVTAQAAAGNEKYAKAFEDLGIDLGTFLRLEPEKRFLALADALKKTGLNTESYAAAATLLGQRFGTELIPTLIRGSAAIEDIGKSAGVMSDQTRVALDSIYRSWQQIRNQLETGIAPVIATVASAWAQGISSMQAVFEAFLESVVGGAHIIDRVLHFDFAGAKDAWKTGLDNMKSAFTDAVARNQQIATGAKLSGKTTEPGFDFGDLAAGGGGGGGVGGGGGGGGTMDQLEAKWEANRLAALTDEQRLLDLQTQRADLQEVMNTEGEHGTLSDQQQLDIQAQIADLDKQIIPLEKQITDAKDQQAVADQKSLDRIDEKIKRSQDEVSIQNLINSGREAEAHLLEINLDYNEKIQKAIDAADEAYARGNTLIGDENEKLAHQLELQKQQALEIARQQALIRGRQETGAPLITSAFQPGTLGGLPLTAGGALNTNIRTQDYAFAQALAANNFNTSTPKFQQDYKRFQAQEQLGQMTGQYQVGFEERAYLNYILDQYAKQQSNAAIAESQKEQQQQIAYLQAIASGRPLPLNYNPSVSMPTSPSIATGSDPIVQLQTQISLMQSQLDQLKTINQKLTPVPGG